MKLSLTATQNPDPPGCLRKPNYSPRFSLPRPHCCEVGSLYAAPPGAPPMTDYQVLHTGVTHSSRRPVGIEFEQWGRDHPEWRLRAGNGVMGLQLVFFFFFLLHRWTPRGAPFNWGPQTPRRNLMIKFNDTKFKEKEWIKISSEEKVHTTVVVSDCQNHWGP